ncbi:hypothetical protein GIW81_10595 [Hyphomicrobium sp. xq]|uniref:Uncharacterized protein n=1 Tax=Hyphomicrobium album TaxID=2665159 RepID=A0A6I3KK91_9HYPH|nr:hypothetical protein [Hyphomicrobium album]MTD94778.1 hypothetical protein [Hyphomicrobium album]
MRVFLSFTEPDFSEVLESAFRSAGVEFDDAPKAERPRAARSAAVRLHQLFERDRELPTSTLSVPLESYLEHQDKRRLSRVGKTTDPRSVADELRITAQMTLSDLNRLRREYALANHPDRAGSAEREDATRRMMVANMLIDREINRRQRPGLPAGR